MATADNTQIESVMLEGLTAVVTIACLTTIIAFAWSLVSCDWHATYVGLVAINTAWLGLRAGLFTAILSAVAYNFFFVEPYWSFSAPQVQEFGIWVGMVASVFAVARKAVEAQKPADGEPSRRSRETRVAAPDHHGRTVVDEAAVDTTDRKLRRFARKAAGYVKLLASAYREPTRSTSSRYMGVPQCRVDPMTPREFLETVVRPNIDNLTGKNGSLIDAYNAVAAVDALAGHLFVWLRQNKPGAIVMCRDDTEYREKLAERSPDFRFLRDLAKAQKHVELRRGQPVVTSVAQVTSRSLGWDEGEPRFNEPNQATVQANVGELRLIEAVIANAIDALQAVMASHGL